MTAAKRELPSGVRLSSDGLRMGVEYYEPINPDDMDAALLADALNLEAQDDEDALRDEDNQWKEGM